MSLVPLPMSRLADIVESRICAHIREENLRLGDALPKEVELAAMLGVSRNIVREALSRLRMLGIVESKKRRGLVVSDPDVLSGIERVMSAAALSERSARELFQFRLVMEIGLADLIYPRRTEADLAELERIARREEQHPNDRELSRECDIAFHGILYKMSGNQIIARFQSILEPYFTRAVREMPPPRRGKDFCSHRGLVELLREGTPAQFRDGMRRHLQQLVDYFCQTSAEG